MMMINESHKYQRETLGQLFLYYLYLYLSRIFIIPSHVIYSTERTNRAHGVKSLIPSSWDFKSQKI